jgi:hypothetical protein
MYMGGMILYIIYEEEDMILCTRKDSVYERDDPMYEEEEMILCRGGMILFIYEKRQIILSPYLSTSYTEKTRSILGV